MQDEVSAESPPQGQEPSSQGEKSAGLGDSSKGAAPTATAATNGITKKTEEKSSAEKTTPMKKASHSRACKRRKKAPSRRQSGKGADWSESTSSSSDSDATESGDENIKERGKKRQKAKKAKKTRDKEARRTIRTEDDSESDSDSESSKNCRDAEPDSKSSKCVVSDNQLDVLSLRLAQHLTQLSPAGYAGPPPGGYRSPPPPTNNRPVDNVWREMTQMTQSAAKEPEKTPKLGFKRVDHVWDNSIHNYKLQDTTQPSATAQADECLFHVRRRFDWEGKYQTTYVDIRSKPLREGLQEVLGRVKGVSLVDNTPKLDPNMLFLYLEDLRCHAKRLKKLRPSQSGSKRENKKNKKHRRAKRSQLKVLVKYLDKDYAEVKTSLYPMLENGLITFELLWALWKPDTLAFTTTYGSHDEPRVFRVDSAERHKSFMKGEFYHVEGKYFEYDGKQFGFGNLFQEIPEFCGARKITSLCCYPLQYHKDEAGVRELLIERGKKFATLGGMSYKSHQGIAYHKRRKAIIKVNVNGRIMIDPSTFRRINPNYLISAVKAKDNDIASEDEDSDDGCGCGSSSDESDGSEEKTEWITKYVKDGQGAFRRLRFVKDSEQEEEGKLEKVETEEEATSGQGDGEDTTKDVSFFSEEEYLMASPVVLGFAFAEKLWLELAVSGVQEIKWNEHAWDSLVLEPKVKNVVKALVESHKYHAASSIDDVIQGKGKGLVAVLHGPPGTGKTLTAEGISELLKCPLYMVSAGELGTDSRFLEAELQKILDICHTWGAILLLDEADVFLEARNMHEIQRNALVSIFLRQLEYFQGILFLTTNRVETFDDAFQSRIHIALKYEALTHRARKTIFKMFIERALAFETETGEKRAFRDRDLDELARHGLNGRQIKNTVRAAQAFAVNGGEKLGMEHIQSVLKVQMKFQNDLAGGPGYEEAMNSYT